MRRARLKAPSSWGVSHYHVVSRVVNRDKVFGAEEKEQFVAFMRLYERLCGVRVLTYCIMSNHFHLFLEVPRKPEKPLTEEELIAVVRKAYGRRRADGLRAEFSQARMMGGEGAAEKLLQGWLKRMWDLSEYMKTLKQRFTQWFNKRHKRKGTLWEDRFRSSLVEGSSQALHMVAAYIDLNPIRAAMVADPKDYRWCGYAEALGRRKLALEGLSKVLEGASGKGEKEMLAAYRVLLFGVGGEQGLREDGSVIYPGFDRERVAIELAKGGRLGRADFLRCRVRYFTDGAVLGSRAFVDGVFEATRERFGSGRRDGARRVGGLGETLYCMRALRVNAITVPDWVRENDRGAPPVG